MTLSKTPAERRAIHTHLAGSGIAALATAAYLTRDGGGSASTGYTPRGGRMVTYEAYTAMFDLLSFIPSFGDRSKSLKDEIYDFNERFASDFHARLVAHGEKLDAADLGLSNRDRLDIIEIMAVSEASLAAKRIEERGSWALRETLAAKHEDFGRPAAGDAR